jgi:hypothetical protein
MAAVAEDDYSGVHTLLGFCSRHFFSREAGDCEAGEIAKQLLLFLNVAGCFCVGRWRSFRV